MKTLTELRSIETNMSNLVKSDQKSKNLKWLQWTQNLLKWYLIGPKQHPHRHLAIYWLERSLNRHPPKGPKSTFGPYWPKRAQNSQKPKFLKWLQWTQNLLKWSLTGPKQHPHWHLAIYWLGRSLNRHPPKGPKSTFGPYWPKRAQNSQKPKFLKWLQWTQNLLKWSLTGPKQHPHQLLAIC